MTHLTSDELIDAMEGLLAADRQAHLAVCEACQRQLSELSGVLGEAKQASAVEPSPLFWDHFSARVREAIDREAAPGNMWPSWLRWQVLAPVATAAIVIVMFAINVRPVSYIGEPIIEDPSFDGSLTADGWATLRDLVGDIDLETASAAGVIEPDAAEQAIVHLTAEEQQELSRLLKVELQRAKS